MDMTTVAPASAQAGSKTDKSDHADALALDAAVPLVLPESLMKVLAPLRHCFTEPTFRTFCELILGQVMAIGPRTACELYAASGMEGHYGRAHRFFSRAKWTPDHVALELMRVLVQRFLPAGGRIELAADGTFFRRFGPQIHQAFWQYDPTLQTAASKKLGYGNGWVVLGLVLDLPFAKHKVCLPLLSRLKCKGTDARPAKTDSQHVADMLSVVEAEFPDRRVLLRVDSAFKLMELHSTQTDVVIRAKADASLCEPAPEVVGKRERKRPNVYGPDLGSLDELAADQRYPWECVFEDGKLLRLIKLIPARRRKTNGLPLSLVLVLEAKELRRRKAKRRAYNLALLCTDTSMSAEEVRQAYEDRWPIETCFRDVKHVTGVGQQRSRTRKAVQRAVPFGLLAHSLILTWYASAVDHERELALHNEARVWHEKDSLSTADAIARLRFEIIVASHFGAQGVTSAGTQKSEKLRQSALRGDTLRSFGVLQAA